MKQPLILYMILIVIHTDIGSLISNMKSKFPNSTTGSKKKLSPSVFRAFRIYCSELWKRSLPIFTRGATCGRDAAGTRPYPSPPQISACSSVGASHLGPPHLLHSLQWPVKVCGLQERKKRKRQISVHNTKPIPTTPLLLSGPLISWR